MLSNAHEKNSGSFLLDKILEQTRQRCLKNREPLDFDKFKHAVYEAVKDWPFPLGLEISIRTDIDTAEIKEIGYRESVFAQYDGWIGGSKKIVLFFEMFRTSGKWKDDVTLKEEIKELVMHELLHFQDHVMRVDIGRMIDSIEEEIIKLTSYLCAEVDRSNRYEVNKKKEILANFFCRNKELVSLKGELLKYGVELYKKLISSGVIPRNENWEKDLLEQLGLSGSSKE